MSGVPQGSTLGLILFNLPINYLSFFVFHALLNFADDKALSASAKSILEFIDILQSESKIR